MQSVDLHFLPGTPSKIICEHTTTSNSYYKFKF